MTKAEAIKTLEDHQHWRLCKDDGCDCTMVRPVNLSKALELAIKVLKENVKK